MLRCDSEFPFRDVAVYKPLLEAIIEAGVTELEDVAHLKPGQVRAPRCFRAEGGVGGHEDSRSAFPSAG